MADDLIYTHGAAVAVRSRRSALREGRGARRRAGADSSRSTAHRSLRARTIPADVPVRAGSYWRRLADVARGAFPAPTASAASPVRTRQRRRASWRFIWIGKPIRYFCPRRTGGFTNCRCGDCSSNSSATCREVGKIGFQGTSENTLRYAFSRRRRQAARLIPNPND